MYIGVSQANSAWLHYRDREWSQAQTQAEAALATWAETAYPLQWLAHWLLLAIALRQNRLPDAYVSAQAMLDPGQQQLPDEIEAVLKTAVAAWESDDKEATHTKLGRALDFAKQQGYL